MAVAALALAAAAGAQTVPRYTPFEIWRDAEDAAFKERWFGRHLASMEAPRLVARDASVGYRSRSRMLVLPTFDRPYFVAIDEPLRGPATVTLVQTDGAGGYGPGAISRREQRPIAAAALEQVAAALNQARFSERTVDVRPGHDEFGQAIKPVFRACTDGTQFVFERRDATAYRLVTRHQCELDGDMRALAATLIGAADVTVDRSFQLPKDPMKPGRP